MSEGIQLEDEMRIIGSYADGKLLAGRIDNIGILLFNQPQKRNAINLEMWDGIAEALDLLEADREVRVVVHAGAGGKAFTSGNDISQFAARRNDADANVEFKRITGRGRNRMASFAKPSVACIQGFCLGGGLATALLADLRVAAADAMFGVPAARLGIAFGLDPMELLVQLVGPSRARLMLYTARRFTALEAQAMGLVDCVVEAQDAVRETLALARSIAENAPLSVLAARFAIGQVMKAPHERDIAAMDAFTRRCMNSADYREGRAAFAEKRKPQFTGE
ncbi:enoyl-CoA hydratase [Paraburkholderia sp. HD33-4]|uniref:enoyl-CoA hydratase n=1 Tax=Paraburkholderia sp. HD33-4 TaxID=2883242 RepID=UPI001F2CB599|nr:enoyl-CoA hydratase [Paraburkholderia sp. HD33-4]